jgi:preprotein translocase subunit SecF
MSTRSFRFRRIFFFFASLLVICGTASIAGWSLNLSLGQSHGKAIGKTFTRNAVVEFEEIKASGKSLKFDERFLQLASKQRTSQTNRFFTSQ